MIGKSYDGTFANGVAATGVDGLTTIVPISAISDWYDYSRMGGIRFEHALPAQPVQLASRANASRRRSSGVAPPESTNARASTCSRNCDERNRRRRRRRHQPVLAGPQLHQGRRQGQGGRLRVARHQRRQRPPGPVGQLVDRPAANNVPRKLWLSQEGHVDPFDYRRAAWVDTLHRWFDYWLQGVQNGIMSEPRVDIETAAGHVWRRTPTGPLPGTAADRRLPRADRSAGTSGSLGAQPRAATPTSLAVHGREPVARPTTLNTPERLAGEPAACSSTPSSSTTCTSPARRSIDILASLSKTQSNLSALLVDYGAGVATSTGRQRRRAEHDDAHVLRRQHAADDARATSTSPSRTTTAEPRGASRRASWTRRTATRCSPARARPR